MEKSINGYTPTQLRERAIVEKDILSKINTHFKRNFIKSKNRYATFDGEDGDYLVEMKTRQVTKNQYPDTLIGANKIKKLKENNKLLCVFRFIDGDFYYWWNENDNNFVTECGLRENPRPHHHIATSLLQSF